MTRRYTHSTREKRWQEKFLAALTNTSNVRASCQAAGIDRHTAYNHRKRSKEFAAAWDKALEDAVDLLEAEAWRRAAKGVEEPVFYKGQPTGTIRRYSDTLLIFLMKANRPEKYRDNYDIMQLAELVRAQAAQSSSNGKAGHRGRKLPDGP